MSTILIITWIAVIIFIIFGPSNLIEQITKARKRIRTQDQEIKAKQISLDKSIKEYKEANKERRKELDVQWAKLHEDFKEATRRK